MEGIIGIICNKSRRFSAGIEYLPVLMKRIINKVPNIVLYSRTGLVWLCRVIKQAKPQAAVLDYYVLKSIQP